MSLDRYLAGEDEQLESAIVECLPLAASAVDCFLSKAPGFAHLRDELEAEANLRLVHVLPKMRRSRTDEKNFNPVAYIRRSIKDCIIQFLRKETNLGMSHFTWRKQTRSGVEVPTFQMMPSGFDVESNPVPVRELRETIYDCCQSTDETRIVEMREQGFTYREIADELGMSLDSVHKYLNAVSARLQIELDPEGA